MFVCYHFLDHSKRDTKQSPHTAPVTVGANSQFYFQSYLQNRDLLNPPSLAATAATGDSATTATITTTQNHSPNSFVSHSLDHLPGYNHPMLNASTSSSVQSQSTVQSPAAYSHFILSTGQHNLAENFPPAPPLPPKHQKALTNLVAKQPHSHSSLLNRLAPQPRPTTSTSSTVSQQYKAPAGIERTPNIFESLVGPSGQSNRSGFSQTPPPVPYSSPKPTRKASCEAAVESSSAKVQNPPKASSSNSQFQLAKSSSQSSTSSYSSHRPLERTVANSIGTNSSSNSYHSSPSLKLVSGNNVCLAASTESTSLSVQPVLSEEVTAAVKKEDCTVTALASTSSSNTSVSSSSSSSPSPSSSSSLPPTPPIRKRTTAPQPAPGVSQQQVRSTLEETVKQDHTQKSGKWAQNTLPPSTPTTTTLTNDDFICASTSSLSASATASLTAAHKDNIDDICNQQRVPSTSTSVQAATNPQLFDTSSAANIASRLGSTHSTNSFVHCPKSLSSGSNLVKSTKSQSTKATVTATLANEDGLNESLLRRADVLHNQTAADDNDYENISTSDQSHDPDDIVAIVSEEFVVISSPCNLLLQSDHSPPNESSSILSSSSSSSSFEQLSIVNSGSTAPAAASSSASSSRQFSRRHRTHEPDPDYDEEEDSDVETNADSDHAKHLSSENMLKPTSLEMANGQPKKLSKRATRDGRRRYAREITNEDVQVASCNTNQTSPTDVGQENLLNDCQNLISIFENSLLISNSNDGVQCSPLSLNLDSDLNEAARLSRRRSSRRRNSNSHSSDDELAAIADNSETGVGSTVSNNCTPTTPASGGSTPTTSTSSSYVNEVCPNEDIELDPALQNNAAANYQHNLEDIVEVSDSGSDDNAEVPPQATPLSGRSREDLNNQYDDEGHLSSFEYHGQYLSSQSRDRSALQSSSSNLSRYSEDDDADEDEADEEQYESAENEENDVAQDVTEDAISVEASTLLDNSATEELANSSASTADNSFPDATDVCASSSSNAMTTSPVHRPLERIGVQSPTTVSNLPKDLLSYGPVVLRNRRHPSHQRRSNTVVLGKG